MSMTIKLCTTTDEYWKVNKSTTTGTNKTVSIVYPCDIIRPVFKLQGGYVNENYITGAFGRKYWITGQTIDKGINYISCVVDAFASWSSSIYGTSQFVNRSEKYYDNLIPDDKFPLENKTETVMLPSDPSTTELIGTDWTTIMGVI